MNGRRVVLLAAAVASTAIVSSSRFAIRPRNQSCLELSRLYSSYQKGDISEAEYREKTVLNRRDPKEQREPDGDWTTGIKRIGNGVKSFFSRIGNGALKLIGQDKESRDKRELSRVMYAEFDKFFEGTGDLHGHRIMLFSLPHNYVPMYCTSMNQTDVFGGLISGLFMQGWFGELMTKMMHEATDQFDRIESKAIQQLESEPAVSAALGTNISLGKPYFATSSTKNIYGLFTKQVLYRCVALGSTGQGQVLTPSDTPFL